MPRYCFQNTIEQYVQNGLTIAVVIPCYNVENQIRSVVCSIPDYVRYRILVNDASQDNTGKILKELADNRVKTIDVMQNSGVGGAVLTGYDEAVKLGADIAVKIDGDDQMDPDHLPALIRPILEDKADYTKRNRFLHSGQIKSMPFLRRIGNIGLSFLAKLATGYWNIFDPTNGYTALNLAEYPLLDKRRISPRYFFETSMLIELGLQRAVVKDVYIPARYGDKKSSLSKLHSLITFPPKLIQALFQRILYLYFVRDFSAVSLFLITSIIFGVFGFAWGIIHWIQSDRTGVPASTGTVMVAVLPLILGIQLLLQAVVMDIQNVPGESLAHQ